MSPKTVGPPTQARTGTAGEHWAHPGEEKQELKIAMGGGGNYSRNKKIVSSVQVD